MRKWDYRKILMAYIEHVRLSEGSDFLDWSSVNHFRGSGLEDDEIEELERVAGLNPPE